MLHHRGHTHTVVVAIFGEVVLWALAAVLWRWRVREWPARDDARWRLLLLFAGTLSHLGLDWTNSHSVHPFWPVDDRWRYGDAVFIIEPWLWVVSVPALVAASTSWVLCVLLLLVLLAVRVLAWRVDLVSTGAAAALTAGAAVSLGLACVLRANARTVAAVVAWVAVTLAMAAGTAKAQDAKRRSDAKSLG